MTGLRYQALRFGSVGVLNTAIGYTLIMLAMWAGAAPLPANAIGYAGGLIVSFMLNRTWTFRRSSTMLKSKGTVSEAKRFVGAFSVAWLLNASVVWISLQTVQASAYFCQLAGVIAYSLSFYVLCRLWVFSDARAG